jgi:hypothetical protein
MNIEQGMYVRYDGEIGKIISMYDKECTLDIMWFDYHYEEMANIIIKLEDIKKASFNIIDLIEIGDSVELEYYIAKYRKRIKRIFEVEIDKDYIFFKNVRCDFTYALAKCESKFIRSKGYNIKIKSILTHEQLEVNKYEVQL